MQKSADIAHSLNELMKVEQLQSISEQFSKELVKVSRKSSPMVIISFSLSRWV